MVKKYKYYYAEANYGKNEVDAVLSVLKNQRHFLMGGNQTLMLEKKVPLKNALTQRIELNQNQIIEDNAFCLMFKKNLDPREKRQREKIILQALSDGLIEASWKKSDNTDLLELASSMGSERLVRYFLEKGLKILPRKNHYSALHRAACLRDSSLSYRIMNMLLEHMREDSAEVLDNLTEAGEKEMTRNSIKKNKRSLDKNLVKI